MIQDAIDQFEMIARAARKQALQAEVKISVLERIRQSPATGGEIFEFVDRKLGVPAAMHAEACETLSESALIECIDGVWHWVAT